MKTPKIFSYYVGLPRSIYLLFLASVINSMGNFVFPFLTLFLTDKLALSPQAAGGYVCLTFIAYLPGSLIGGKLADHLGRKRILVISQTLAALCLIPCAFLGKSMAIPDLLILSGVMAGAAQPANDAMVADLTGLKNRKASFSLLYMGWNIGFAIGPVMAGFLYTKHTEWIFWGDASTTLITVLLIILFVKETRPAKAEAAEGQEISEKERAVEGSVFHVLIKRPAILAFAFLSIAYTFSYSQGSFSTILLAKEIYAQGAAQIFGMLASVNGIVVITLTAFIIYLARKNRPVLNVALAGIFYAVGFGMLYFISSISLFVLSTVIWTVGEILCTTNSRVYIADNSPMSHRGRVNSILNIIARSGSALGPLLTGGYIQRYGVRMVWPLVFVLMAVASFFMFTLYIVEKRKSGITSQEAASQGAVP